MIIKTKTKASFAVLAFWGMLMLISLAGAAQDVGTINGHVTDVNLQPLEGTTVHVRDGGAGVLTGKDGAYQIRAAKNAVLEFTRVGFQPVSINVAGKSTVDVQMQETSGQMSDVIVTALGIKKDKRALTYATQEIAGSDITNVKDPGGNVVNALAGKVANLVVTPAAAGPGSASKVVLRGNRSINGNNNALIVVDGVPIDNTMSTEASGGGSANTFGTQVKSISSGYSGMDGASSINPEDIESITVLKGPAAAALYGSRAANGAMVITTKSGKAGKMTVNYNGGISMDMPYYLMKFQNTYGRGNGGEYAAAAGQSWGPSRQTYGDNVSSFYNTGVLINNSVDVSGGTDKIKGFASYANNSTSGIIPKNKLRRDNLNLRLWAQIIPKLTLDAKISYLNQKVDHLPRLGDQGINNEVYIMPRDLSRDSLGIFESIDPATGQPAPIYWTNSSTFVNPYWEVNRMVVNQSRDRIMIMAALKYQLTDWLSLQARYSLDKYNDEITGSYYDRTTMNPFNTPGGLYRVSDIHHWERNMDLLLSGNNDLSGDFHLSYNLGASVLNIEGGNITTTANGLSVANKFDLNFASSLDIHHVPIKKEIQSVYGNVQFDYKKLIYLDASLRNDWASTLPPPYSYAYPSVGLTAILSDILHMPSWVTLGKVRAAYTNVGNDADPYMLNQRYEYSQGAGGGFISRDDTKSIADLKPEQTHSIEIGTQWQFFNNRLGIDATYYKNNTKNQLVSIGLPAASGFQFQYVNVGNIENKGFELMIMGNPIHKAHFDWFSNVNFALNRNKIIALKEGVDQTTLSPSSNFGQLIIKPGGAYGDIYGYGWAKDPATGAYLINNNGLPVATASNDQKLGNFNPDYTLGWHNEFAYNRFSLSFQIDGRIGGILMSGTDALLSNYGVLDYTAKFRDGGLILPGVHVDGSKNETAISAEQLWTTLSNGGRSSGFDEFFAYSATNFRLRALSVGYDVPIKSSAIKALKVSLTASNLLFFYRGKSLIDLPGIGKRTLPVDPESAIGTSNFQGIESGLPPAVRGLGLNLHLQF